MGDTEKTRNNNLSRNNIYSKYLFLAIYLLRQAAWDFSCFSLLVVVADSRAADDEVVEIGIVIVTRVLKLVGTVDVGIPASLEDTRSHPLRFL